MGKYISGDSGGGGVSGGSGGNVVGGVGGRSSDNCADGGLGSWSGLLKAKSALGGSVVREALHIKNVS